MKKILLPPLKILLKLFGLIQALLGKILFYANVLMIYLAGKECAKLSDCLLLAKLKRAQPPASDRFIEYPWMLENLTLEKGRLLDIGSTIGGQLNKTLPETVEINCLNLNAVKSNGAGIKFKKGDIRQIDYPDNYFDAITCISTLEHIGVAGRYGSDDDPAGDLKAMEEIKRILKPGGVLLATVPYGAKDVLPINKLYNQARVNSLFADLEIISQEFRKFDKNWHVWLKANEAEAAKTDMRRDGWYALCLIKAQKKVI